MGNSSEETAKRAERPDRSGATRRRLRTLLRFPILILVKSIRDGVFLKASALAFVSILSLVPLLAAFSFVGEALFQQYQHNILDSLGRILPYSEETLIERLTHLLEQAEAIRGTGFLSFLVISLFAFSTIERTLNEIWSVSGRRPLRVRILSFTLLLFWGPIFVGAVLTSLVFLRQLPGLAPLMESPLAELIPLFAILVGLTMLYWLTPYAQVRFKSALSGGVVATVLLGLLRQGFGIYVQAIRDQVNVVYGGLGLVLLFMISLELSWIIILVGCELAYTTQHFQTLLRTYNRPSPPHRLWVGLAVLCLIASRFSQREPVTPRETLAETLGIPEDNFEPILAPLIKADLLRREGTDRYRYLLPGDPHHLTLRSVFQLYDVPSQALLEELPPPLSEPLERLRTQVLDAQLAAVAETTLADLVARVAQAEPDAVGASLHDPTAPASDAEA